MEDLVETLRNSLKGILPEAEISKFLEIASKFQSNDSLIKELGRDVINANNQLNNDPENQFFRRTIIRTIFADIEGKTSILKQMIYAVYEFGQIELLPEELALLKEESYELENNGKIKIKDKFLRLPENIRFTVNLFSRTMLGEDRNIDVSGKEWNDFKLALKVRNCLMHPKSIEDLNVNLDEITSALHASTWFAKQVTELLNKAGEISQKRTMEYLLKNTIGKIDHIGDYDRET